MKKFAAALAFAAVMASGAAFADTIQNGYGNTFVVTTAQGSVNYYLNEDGTFSFTAPNGQTVNGTYQVADGQLCLAAGDGQPACSPYVGDKNVGDTWTQTGADGSTITVELRAGR